PPPPPPPDGVSIQLVVLPLHAESASTAQNVTRPRTRLPTLCSAFMVFVLLSVWRTDDQVLRRGQGDPRGFEGADVRKRALRTHIAVVAGGDYGVDCTGPVVDRRAASAQVKVRDRGADEEGVPRLRAGVEARCGPRPEPQVVRGVDRHCGLDAGIRRRA